MEKDWRQELKNSINKVSNYNNLHMLLTVIAIEAKQDGMFFEQSKIDETINLIAALNNDIIANRKGSFELLKEQVFKLISTKTYEKELPLICLLCEACNKELDIDFLLNICKCFRNTL